MHPGLVVCVVTDCLDMLLQKIQKKPDAASSPLIRFVQSTFVVTVKPVFWGAFPSCGPLKFYFSDFFLGGKMHNF